MLTANQPPAALARAYRATAYCVHPNDTATWMLRADQPTPPELNVWLIAEQFFCWSLLTACNPAARRLPDAENAAQQADLSARLIREGWRSFPGENRADANDWPPEATFWIPGMSQSAATALARAYGQNAFLWGCLGQNAELVWVA